MDVDAAIVDFSAGLLLRYFRRGQSVGTQVPRVDHRRDLELLRAHWSISQPVRQLVGYVLSHPQEMQGLLKFRTRVDDAVARGRIDARRTYLHRLQTGLSSAIVAQEPVRSFETGPNMLLAWVLREAAIYTARLADWQAASSPYGEILSAAQAEMRRIHRLEALREPLRLSSLGRRPSAGDMRSAARSRRQAYRLALEAYKLLEGLERGDEAAIAQTACSALIAPLEVWRRFELAVALAVGEAIAEASGAALSLHLLNSSSAGPIATAGRFAIYWQQRTDLYVPPDLEASEKITRDILAAFDMTLSADRPDLVVVDREASAVAAIVEVKYVAGDSAPSRFREAVDQVVRYARGYAPGGGVEPILSRSLVAISRDAPPLADLSARVLGSVDAAVLMRGELSTWASRLVRPSPSQTL